VRIGRGWGEAGEKTRAACRLCVKIRQTRRPIIVVLVLVAVENEEENDPEAGLPNVYKAPKEQTSTNHCRRTIYALSKSHYGPNCIRRSAWWGRW
jgi:hypothetical protein